MKPFVAYCRASTDRQGKSALGLEAQRVSVVRFVSTSGGEIVADFKEIESGSRNDRPQLQAAALLYTEADGKVLHQRVFNSPANQRVRGTEANLNDWIGSSDAVRAQIVARLFPAAKTDAFQLWRDTRGAIERNQVSDTDPLATLVRIQELAKPTAPIPVKQMPPKFPIEMRRAGIAGDVVVAFRIKEDGTVTEVKAVRSSQREFEAAAIAWVTGWRYKPAALAGKPIAVEMSLPIVFTLNER